MTYNDFTIKAQDAILQAQTLGKNKDHKSIDTYHLLIGIMDIDEDISRFLFEKMSVNMNDLRQKMETLVGKHKVVRGDAKQHLSKECNLALSRAKKLRKTFDDEFISLELIIMGLIKGTDITADILKESGATEEGMEKAIKALRKGKSVKSQTSETGYNVIEKFAVCLNDRAESGELDPIVGRDEEIRRVLHILSRRKKNNPLLIGEPVWVRRPS